jgi:DNA sulfur modification protein DndB
MMRPVIQKAVVRALHHIMEQQSLDWKTCLVRISELPWHIDQAPWLAVFNPVNCKMVTAKENADILEELLIAHIAPTSKNVIARARKNYREIRNSTYPVSALEMEEALI